MPEYFDTVVVGGGTAGAVAALASARGGVRTLLIESSGKLGGMAATGMTWGGFFDRNHRQVIRGVPDTLVNKAAAQGSGRGHTHCDSEDRWISSLASVDPTYYSYLISNELMESGCHILMDSRLQGARLQGNRVERISVLSKFGTLEFSAGTFIDTTGDAALADRAGVECKSDEDGKRQCLSRIFRVCNIDFADLETYMETELNTEKRSPWKVESASMRAAFHYWCPWKAEGFDSMPKLFGIYWHGVPGDLYINCTSVDIDCLDARQMSVAAGTLQNESFRVFDYLQRNIPGFERSYLAHVYEIGVRVSRRIRGRYCVTLDDILNHKTYADTIGFGAYPPDVHSPDGEADIRHDGNIAYAIPYGAMVPRSVANLLVAGRCISTTFEAQSALRGIGPCMVEGEAAGTAAVLSAKEKTPAADLSTGILLKRLGENNVWLG